jgi:hypothetical protein
MVEVRTSAGRSMLPGCKRFALLCVDRAGEPVDPDFTASEPITPILTGQRKTDGSFASPRRSLDNGRRMPTSDDDKRCPKPRAR